MAQLARYFSNASACLGLVGEPLDLIAGQNGAVRGDGRPSVRRAPLGAWRGTGRVDRHRVHELFTDWMDNCNKTLVIHLHFVQSDGRVAAGCSELA